MSTLSYRNPLVTIIIPVYNGSNYLKEAIDSALSQTYKNIEIIVVNDGSTDNTEEIALSYGDKIRYFKKLNGGVSSALNLGIKVMKGEYFSWLSHDDMYSPYKIYNQIESLNSVRDQEHLIFLCGTAEIDKDSKLFKKQKNNRFPKKGLYETSYSFKELLEKGAFNGCSLLIPKRAFAECGMFDENLRYSQDSFMWMKLFLFGYSLVYDPEIAVFSRIHNVQLSQTGRSVFRRDSIYIAKHIIPLLSSKSTQKDNFLFFYAKRNTILGNKDVRNMCLEEAKKTNLFSLRQKIIIYFYSTYALIRPIIRRLYYRLFKKVRTE